ncbi:molybdate ABC transporter substrate-binding protein [uncultured Jatrophihabitans sp.]|uniref:molybdate ABC transporter substrate-binding protein n=1 Tax=uncultured Jatrophihabitans sp. TaxID=1610747 RepID=UPI0035CB924B
MKLLVSLIALATAGATLAGCSSSGGSGTTQSSSSSQPNSSQSSPSQSASPTTLNVYAAASLTGAFTTIATQFEKAHQGAKVSLKFGGSSDLATAIAQAAPVDVFASASPKTMATVVSGGFATDPVNFVSNSLEIAVPPSNPGHVTSLQDLAKPSVKVALCEPSVPCGAVAAQVFKKAKIAVKPKASLPDVKTTLATVESGEAYAGCVYVTDVLAAGAKVKGIKVPDSLNASTEYPIAALTHAKQPALAKAFVAYVLSPAGRSVLTADGFKAP